MNLFTVASLKEGHYDIFRLPMDSDFNYSLWSFDSSSITINGLVYQVD